MALNNLAPIQPDMDALPVSLVITHSGGNRTVALPPSGTLTVGRSRDSDVWIDDTLVSRGHAVFHTTGGLFVEDLGSHNGTLLIRASSVSHPAATGGAMHERLAPGARVALAVGDVVQIGRALLLVSTPEPLALADDDAAEGGGESVILDPTMRNIAALIERIAPTDISVILLGESGVGKEVFARRIHQQSLRSGPFLGLNCSAMPDQLLESELFGYEKGAFTGATTSKAGLLESAGAGTVFLDEIGELAAGLQVKLLRVLEERAVRRIGALTQLPIAARFLSATNRSLEAEIAAGRFREDFYYRLNGVSLVIPPLRERPSEIVPLARRFVRQLCQSRGRSAPRLLPAAEDKLEQHRWPGNIRELRSVIELALALCGEGAIGPDHLIVSRRIDPGQGGAASRGEPRGPEVEPETEPVPAPPRRLESIKERASEDERRVVMDALEQCAGNQTRAAQLLGISRRQLTRRLDRLDIPRPRKGRRRTQ